MSEPFVLRVGILGAASITWQVWDAIHHVGAVVTYVGCRDTARGKEHVEAVCSKLGIPAEKYPSVGSYEEVIESKEVDLVYIPIPTALRHPLVLKCAEHHKHVVGEKPAANTADEVRQWVEAMDQRQLLFMDGTMLSHSRRVKEVNATLKELGRPVQYINVHFTFNGGEDFVAKDIRLNPVLEPQGCLGDVGWYCVRYILHLMGEAMPSEVSGRVIRRDGEHKGIVEFSGEITFDVNGQLTVASLFCGFDACCQHTLTAFTPDASVVLKDFAHPVVGQDATYYVVRDKANATSATDRHSWREEEAHTVKDESTNSQRYDMWRHILDILYPVEEEGGRRLKAKEEESRHWATLTWKTQAVLDKLLESALIAEQQAAQ